MATVSKEIADDIIAGKYDDDTPAIRIVKYQNQFNGEDSYGVIYQGEDPLRYHRSPACRNPSVYWDRPAYRHPHLNCDTRD